MRLRNRHREPADRPIPPARRHHQDARWATLFIQIRRGLLATAEIEWEKRVFRKPSFPANCSVGRTEERIPFGDSSDKRERHKNQRVSLDASRQLEICNKRSNMIKSLRRWATLSPALPDAERPHRLAMLDRAEAMLDDWYGRSPEDRRCYDLLAAQARAKPLDAAIVRSLRQQPRPPDDNSIGAILASQGWYHGDRIDQSSRRGACAS